MPCYRHFCLAVFCMPLRTGAVCSNAIYIYTFYIFLGVTVLYPYAFLSLYVQSVCCGRRFAHFLCRNLYIDGICAMLKLLLFVCRIAKKKYTPRLFLFRVGFDITVKAPLSVKQRGSAVFYCLLAGETGSCALERKLQYTVSNRKNLQL